MEKTMPFIVKFDEEEIRTVLMRRIRQYNLRNNNVVSPATF
jgi:hypothetical protein